MAKNEKHAEVMQELHKIIEKEAAEKEAAAKGAKPAATGVPSADTKYQSINNTQEVDKNKIGPETLTPQNHEQHASTDTAAPVKAGEEAPVVETPVVAETEKSATEIGKEVLAMIEQYKEAAVKGAKPTATGKPSADTKYQSINNTQEVDKNKIGPETLTPQNHEQHAATDASRPVATAKKADVTPEDVNKVASYELGKSLAEMFLKSAQEQEAAMLKEAGRRDFELMITQAAAELEAEKQKTASALPDKQAEEAYATAEAAGASAFQDLMKQAQVEYAFAELQKKAEEAEKRAEAAEKKAAEALAKEATLAKQAAEQAEMAKYSALADYIKNEVLNGLKQEISKS